MPTTTSSAAATTSKSRRTASASSSGAGTPSLGSKYKKATAVGEGTTNEERDSGLCPKCEQGFSPGIDSIECESCQGWFHLECAGFIKSDLKTISKKGIHWYCNKCDGCFSSIIIKLHELSSQIDTLAKANENERSEVQSYAEVVKKFDVTSRQNQVMQEQVSKQLKTIRDDMQAEQRALNLVLFGVREPDETNQTSDILTDIDSIFKDCGLNYKLTKSQVYRLGPKKTDSTRPRPLKVCLESEFDKWEVLRRINSIKPQGIYGRLDLSREEQEKDFRLRQELKKTREEDPEGKYKIYQKKIIKLKPTN